MITTDVLVIGAGPTGIGAAVRLAQLGLDHLVVEASAEPGGMAASVRDDHGFTWDLGGHVIHSHFAAFDDAIAAAGTELIAVRRNGAVWMDGTMHPAPIQQALTEMPTDLDPDAPADNLLEYFGNSFGAELTARFFRPHVEKMWAYPASKIAHEWTSLRGGSDKRNVPQLSLARDAPVRPAEYFPYPAGGTGAVWHDIHARLTERSRFRFGTSVIRLDLAARTAHLADGTSVRYETCISTAPLTTAREWAAEVSSAPVGGGPLATAAVYAIGLGYEGSAPDNLADKTYVASPDQDVPWYRASVLSNYDPANAGPDRWSVLCEVSTSEHRPVTAQDAVQSTRDSLVKLGADPTRLVSTWLRYVPMGYPIPTLRRDDTVRELDAVLLRHGVYSRGRFGGWRYESCNQDYSFAQGIGAVEHAVSGAPEDVYWHPERF